MNNNIRTAINLYLQANGKEDTRTITTIFAKQFNTSKQRIAGNLRAMKYNYGSINIITIVPNHQSLAM